MFRLKFQVEVDVELDLFQVHVDIELEVAT